MLRDGGYGAYSTHFGAIAEDGRFARLPLAAASSLMAKGYGYGAEGDALTRRADVGRAARCSARRSSPRCTRWTSRRDSILMSHMGEGNWRLAREDRPVRLIKRPLGIGGLGDPPTFLFQYAHRPGDARDARRRSAASASGCWSPRARCSTPPSCRTLEMPYGHFRPDSGVRDCMDAWLRLGGPHHQVLNPGRQAEAWRVFSELAGLEFAAV